MFRSKFWVVLCLIGLSAYAQEKGFKEEVLTQGNYDNRYASYSKTGEHIIFESNRDGRWQIYLMDVNGNNQRRLITSDANDRRPSWNNLNNEIIFESDRNGYTDIYTYNLDTKSLSKVPIPLKGNKTHAQFAPNGAEIVFNYKVSDNNYNIYRCSLKGKRLKKLIDNAYKNVYPRFTSKGDAIVYYSAKHTKGEDDEIYAYNIILKKDSRLSNWPTHNRYPDWSNNDHKIAYATEIEDGTSEIYTMTKFGKSVTRITFNAYDDILPTWSPQDFNLLVSSKRNGNYQIVRVLLKEALGEE